MKPEETVETHLRDRAEALGFLCYKFTSPGNNGVPDRILIGHGATIFVETKAPGGKPRKLQQKVIDKINAHGGTALVASTEEEVDKILETIIKQNTCPKKVNKKTSK